MDAAAKYVEISGDVTVRIIASNVEISGRMTVRGDLLVDGDTIVTGDHVVSGSGSIKTFFSDILSLYTARSKAV